MQSQQTVLYCNYLMIIVIKILFKESKRWVLYDCNSYDVKTSTLNHTIIINKVSGLKLIHQLKCSLVRKLHVLTMRFGSSWPWITEDSLSHQQM